MPRLKVSIGTHRTQLHVAHVNDSSKPFEVESELFVGRVLVRVKDFDGITPDGSPPAKAAEYFAGRSRAFSIYIEGRFKAREGVEPYRGDEVLFGSDFDHMVQFPRHIFNAGMKIAKFVDQCVFYEENAKRPFIMSPYVACMNSLAAWAAPHRVKDAVVCRRAVDYGDDSSSESDSELDIVPEEVLEARTGKKEKDKRHEIPHWRFVGLKGEAEVDKWLETHADELLKAHDVHHDPHRKVHEAIGVPKPAADASSSSLETDVSSTSGSPIDPKAPKKIGSMDSGRSHFSMGSLRKALHEGGEKPSKREHHDHWTTADHLSGYTTPTLKHGTESKLDGALGRWRFVNPAVDMIEDNTFVFRDKSITVPKRRKYFQTKQHRVDFVYNPDIVYGAAFYSPFGDLNKFDVNMSSFVHINVRRFLGEMPIRYTLRSTRTAKAPNGEMEEEVFVTVEFALVD